MSLAARWSLGERETAKDALGLERSGRERLGPLAWEEVAAIVILLAAAVTPRGHVSDTSVVFFLRRVFWWVIYVGATASLTQRFGARWVKWTLRRQRTLCVLLALIFASSLWSLLPSHTFWKAASLVGTTVTGWFIGHVCSPPRLMRVLHWTFALLIVSSIAAVVLVPVPREGWEAIGWRGLMQHKNGFGAMAVWATLFFVVVTLGQWIRPLWGVPLCAVSAFALAVSYSRTSWMALLIAAVAFGASTIAAVDPRRLQTRLRRMALGLVLCIALLPFVFAPLARSLGEADPFHGRAYLWADAIRIVRERPASGYGYAVVWGRKEDSLLPHIRMTKHRSAESAHNEALDLATQLGIPAAILACTYLFGALSAAASHFGRERSVFSLFALLFMVSFAVMNFTEAHLLAIHSVFWILFVALAVAAERALGGGIDTE